MGYLPYLSTFDSALVVIGHVGLEDSIGGLESLATDTGGAFVLNGMACSILSLALDQLVRQQV